MLVGMERAANGEILHRRRDHTFNETIKGALENAQTDKELQAEVREALESCLMGHRRLEVEPERGGDGLIESIPPPHLHLPILFPLAEPLTLGNHL